MSKSNVFPALNLRKSSQSRGGGKCTPSHHQQEKQRLLDGMASGEHLITLLGAACRYIGELTDDPKFYREAKRCVRCRGIAENHIPSKIERWEQLQEEIERTRGRAGTAAQGGRHDVDERRGLAEWYKQKLWVMNIML